MTTKKTSPDAGNDIEAILAEPTALTLESGFYIRVNRLKTRGLLKLLKIFTRGAGDVFAQVAFSDNTEEFGGQLVGLLIASFPEAENEVIDFINAMVEPDGLVARPTSKEDKRRNEELEAELRSQLEDPELGDLLTIAEAIFANEAEDIQSLGKRLSALTGLALKS